MSKKADVFKPENSFKKLKSWRKAKLIVPTEDIESLKPDYILHRTEENKNGKEYSKGIVERGDFIIIVGKPGCGKSSHMDAMVTCMKGGKKKYTIGYESGFKKHPAIQRYDTEMKVKRLMVSYAKTCSMVKRRYIAGMPNYELYNCRGIHGPDLQKFIEFNLEEAESNGTPCEFLIIDQLLHLTTEAHYNSETCATELFRWLQYIQEKNPKLTLASSFHSPKSNQGLVGVVGSMLERFADVIMKMDPKLDKSNGDRWSEVSALKSRNGGFRPYLVEETEDKKDNEFGFKFRYNVLKDMEDIY